MVVGRIKPLTKYRATILEEICLVCSKVLKISSELSQRMGLLAALAVNAVGGTVIYATGGLGAAWVAPMLGFSNSGIVGGSVAAAAQSFYGNVAAGSVIAKMTSVAMLAPTP
ncbi:unnamed protein product, partial [Brenthis ino]